MAQASIDYNSEEYWQKLINQSLIRFFILRALKEKDLHGYLLIKEVRRISNDFCSPSESTLYPALAQMSKAGLIQQTTTPQKERKTYHLTQKGRESFKAAAKVWNTILPTIQRKALL